MPKTTAPMTLNSRWITEALFAFFPAPAPGNQGGHTGPDILAQRNEHSGLPVYHTVERQRLQDTYRSRGALDNGGNHSAGQHRENGIPAKDGKSLCKYGRFSVWLNRIGHEGKANKQDTEAYQNLSDFFLFSDFVKSTRNAPIPKSSGAKNSGFITLPIRSWKQSMP